MTRPQLSSAFFSSVAIAPDFWRKWSARANWTDTFVPLYEWESILYVGLGNPNDRLNGDQSDILGDGLYFKVIFIDANPEELKNHWLHLKSSTVPTPKIPNAPDIPNSMGLSRDGAPLDPFANLESEVPQKSIQDLTAAEFGIENILEASAPATADLPIEPGPISPPVELRNEFAEMMLEQMQAHYKKSMFLKKEQNQLSPWHWDKLFHGPTQTSPINLETPSPFRIALQSLKPYHGHVVPGEVQEKFFDEWNESEIPDYLTITPLIVADQVVGMLLGIAEKDVNPKASLHLAEKIAQEYSEILSSKPELLSLTASSATPSATANSPAA